LLLPRFDIVIALTSPPLISVLGALFVQLKGGRFCFWVMDLNPDEAVAAGWLKEGSLTERILSSFLRYSLRHTESVIVLDRFMKRRVLTKGIPEERVAIMPPWSLGDAICYDERGRESFRERHNLSQSFVVMYSGNHSPCHPLDTLLEAAERLSSRKEIAFCFVGGGSEQTKVKAFAARRNLSNITCLPYQPLAELSASLSSADLHAVVMGDEFTGIIHPCKVYNILTIGTPILYIGPRESHVGDIAAQSQNGYAVYQARHGQAEAVVGHILEAAGQKSSRRPRSAAALASKFARDALLPQMIALLEAKTLSSGTQTVKREAKTENGRLTAGF
jgi:colanic acid biosynthesis glycosyl transferase WcaI